MLPGLLYPSKMTTTSEFLDIRCGFLYIKTTKPQMTSGTIQGDETMAKIHSVPGIFGGEDFYDESGQKVGYTVPGLFGGRDFYNADGQPAGYSVDSVISGENFYDANGAPSGYSTDGILGGKDYFDASGRSAGWSTDSLFGGENIRLNGNPFGTDHSDGFCDMNADDP